MAKATSTSGSYSVITEKRSTAKLAMMREIEINMQKLWADLKVFEADAPDHPSDK